MKKSNVLLVMISMFILTAASYAQTTINAQKIDSLLTKMSGYDKILGTIAISQQGKIVYYKKFGSDISQTNIEDITSTEYKYRIGSISKMFTAVMIFQLIEEKKLSLESKLSEFFINIPNASEITIDNLLNHHSGLFSFTNDPNYKEWLMNKKSKDELLKMFEAQKPVFNPGEKCEYSNTNFSLLGYIIETLTGNTYEEELNKRIIEKLGLKNTYYGSKTDTSKNEVFSYTWETNKWEKSAETDMSIPGGAGAVVSTPADLIRFIEALLNGKLISSSSLDSMKTVKGKYGRGLFVKNGDVISYGHSGAIDAFLSDLYYYPKQNTSIAISYNGLNCNRQKILQAVFKIINGEQVDLSAFDIITLPKEKLVKYEGEYTSKDLHFVMTLKVENNKLLAQATNQPPFFLDAKSEFLFEQSRNGAELEFPMTDQASISQFTLKQNGKQFLFTKE